MIKSSIALVKEFDLVNDVARPVASSKGNAVDVDRYSSRESRNTNRKRPSFLTDLRDQKNFKQSKQKCKDFSIDSHVSIISVGKPNADKSTNDSNLITADDSPNTDPVSTNTARQVNWLATGSLERSSLLLNRNADSKDRKANAALRYGW
jgi:hypothetical protein